MLLPCLSVSSCSVFPDRSLNLENVSRVMKTLKDWKRICDVLSVPDSRKKKIQSMTERRQEVVEWWLKFSPNASWNWLAGRLHFLEERTALKAVRKYIHKETEGMGIFMCQTSTAVRQLQKTVM